MKLILQFLKRITLFSKNKSNALEDNNTSLPESKKKNLLQKKKEEIMKSLSFDKRSPQSYELQRKLALLVSNIDKIDKRDIGDLEHRRYRNSKEDDFISYRIDFRNKDDLEFFKEKYKNYLL
tara:strand:+ start:104 stop:469 length:366 start_codon:yes stop_codon:yes gene_type:complete